MRCPRCQHDSPSSAKFCSECGACLAPACAACGTELPAGTKFCLECGQPAPGSPSPQPDPRAYTPKYLAEKILRSRIVLEGERKQVTVLFADVKGSMDLAEQLDPEAWHGIMDRFFQLLAEGVHRFEGTVVQFTGDGIMALFGAPIAHEDHAQRACYAMLHLCDALARYAGELKRARGLSFSVRMGLNSGEVVVGKIGDDLRMDYTALGHTVGLAQRMEQLAEPGTVYLTEHTAALVSGFFRLEDLGEFAVKGMGRPLRVFALRGMGPLRTRLEVSRRRGFSRLVGRREESAILDAALARALAGNGQVVGVVGEPGVGKSRLCFEFAERCRARGMSVYEAHCVPHGKTIPFLPVLELMRGYFGIGEQDADQVAREKITGRLVLLDKELTETLPLLFDFLGVTDPEHPPPRIDPEARQRQLFGMVRRLVRARAQGSREPGVVLIEDLHWNDGGSEAFLANHVEALAGTRALLLVTFRPEYHAGWMQKSYYQQLPLRPLGPSAIDELLRDLLGSDPSLGDLGERIRARTGGNPLFIEEAVQALADAGSLEGTRGAFRLMRPVEQLSIPATVQAVLASRIDRLAERDKLVLQTASVIGKEFTEPVLRQVADMADAELEAALRVLTAAEFIYEEALFPEAGYAFKHPLAQEVAYRSQLAERRARVHAAVARAVAASYPEKLDERAALLAHHWEAAGDLLEAARWSGRAADWVGYSDSAEACRHWDKVRALLETVPDSAETAALGLRARVSLLSLGWRLGITEEDAARLFAEGRALGERSGDAVLLAYLLSAYGTVRGMAGRVEEHLAHSVEAMRLAERTNPLLELELRASAAYPHYLAGQLHDALGLIDSYLESAGDGPRLGFGGFDIGLFAVWFRALLLRELGRVADGMRQLERAKRLARDHGATEILGWVHFAHVLNAGLTGEVESALADARQCLEIALRIGSAFSRSVAYQALGYAHLLRGEWSESARAMEEALAIARERRTGIETETAALAALAEAHLGAGDHPRARTLADEAVAAASRRGATVFEPQARLTLARVLLRTEGARARGAIEAALERAHAVVTKSGARIHAPFIHLERAELARLTGNSAAHVRELREAQRLFAEMGATARAEQVARQLD